MSETKECPCGNWDRLFLGPHVEGCELERDFGYQTMSEKPTILDVLGPGILYDLGVASPPKRERGKVTVSLIVDVDYMEKDIWPDNDAPDEWDAQDVKKVISDAGWNNFLEISIQDIDVTVPDVIDGKSKRA